ncbi:MAG: ribonuclease III [Chloroflexota bacterium]|nr:ribonuclease III [Chloroflexota bacterium]
MARHEATTTSETDGTVTFDDRPERFARALGIEFNDIGLLRLALTHRSVAHELRSLDSPIERSPAERSNERLEFLGDAVLGFVVARDLYERYPDSPEGVLTARRVALVRAERLVSWARAIDLGDYLYLAQGERISDSARDRMLSGGFEALLGAIMLDGGIEAAANFLERFLDEDVETSLAEGLAANPKGLLQEYAQEHYRVAPLYRIIDEEGPDHARVFTAEVLINDRSLGIGTGESKRAAEQAAAAQALRSVEGAAGRKATGTVRKRRKRAAKGEQNGNG